MPSNHISRSAIGTGLILLIPFVFTLLNPNSHFNGGSGGGADWGPLDFLIMGLLLFVTGLAISFAVQKFTNPFPRMAAVCAIIFVLLAIWVELAVDGVSRLLSVIF